jgi:hypothetical protein
MRDGVHAIAFGQVQHGHKVLRLQERTDCKAALDDLHPPIIKIIFGVLSDRDVVCVAGTCRRLRRLVRSSPRLWLDLDPRLFHMVVPTYESFCSINQSRFEVARYCIPLSSQGDVASMDEIVAAEKFLGMRLPEQYRACLLNHFNGRRWPAFKMMSLTKAIAWRVPGSKKLPLAQAHGGDVVFVLDIPSGCIEDPYGNQMTKTLVEFFRRNDSFY